MTTVGSYIRRYALDRLLSPDLLQALRPVHREPGDLIIRAGDPARDLLFFVEGRTMVYSVLDNGQSVLASFYGLSMSWVKLSFSPSGVTR